MKHKSQLTETATNMPAEKRMWRIDDLLVEEEDLRFNLNPKYDAFYQNWRFMWKIGDRFVKQDGALALYEDAYFEFFKTHRGTLDWLVKTAGDVGSKKRSPMWAKPTEIEQPRNSLYHSHKYSKQEPPQDTAVRRCLIRNKTWFEGTKMIKLTTEENGTQLAPENVPFHYPELILQPRLEGPWKQNSIQDFYKSNRLIYVNTEAGSISDRNIAYSVESNSWWYKKPREIENHHIIVHGQKSYDPEQILRTARMTFMRPVFYQLGQNAILALGPKDNEIKAFNSWEQAKEWAQSFYAKDVSRVK